MHSPRRLTLARVAPLALLALATPLLAPTCGGGSSGLKAFSKGSLIIPMDECYQYDGTTATSALAPCADTAATRSKGDVIKAYGLVYQLVRAGVPVYWVIRADKAALDGVDMTVQLSSALPVHFYNWTTPSDASTAPAAGAQGQIDYRGGPFVVDGTDFAAASQVLQTNKATFSGVKVHVSNVAFQANVTKTMSGGWSAGGTVTPRLALLNIGSDNAAKSDAKNAEPIIQGYLANAGLDFTGAGGTTAAGAHGVIYDKLTMADFQPAAGSTDWRTSNFGKGGYQVLWVPHWWAPGSCADASSSANCTSSRYTAAQIQNVIQSIGAFVKGGGDLMAECAGLGSFEGVFTSATATHADFGAGDASTELQATNGLEIKSVGGAISYSDYPSPLMQIGDFPFTPVTGAIENYEPSAARTSAFRAPVQQLVYTAAAGWSYFTLLPPAPGVNGTVVYLAGHDYSTNNAVKNFAGQRLVLNTLFNLGSSCTATGTACNTGELGECAAGTMQCDAATGQPVCKRLHDPSAETCDGKDNDCNGIVDDVPVTASPTKTASCYDGPAATRGVGVCHDGAWQCANAAWVCVGEQLPGTEICNGLDDDCDGKIDDNVLPPGGAGTSSACYTGPAGTQGVGSCKAGAWTCNVGVWSCVGEVLPTPQRCNESGSDDNCDGNFNENCACVPGTSQPCYSGPAGTAGIGACRSGTMTCTQVAGAPAGTGKWSACTGQVLPAPETCNGVDDDCNGFTDDAGACDVCKPGDTQACYTGPAATRGLGTCADGKQACVAGQFAGACDGEVLPAQAELCDGKDNDCNGKVDDGATCPTGQACVNGACTFATCGVESPCREGYACGADGKCAPAACGSGPVCPQGQICSGGSCVDPCAGVACGHGAVCSGGACVGGGCYATGCAQGQLCVNGACQPDACAGLSCPAGTFCRLGDCVQSCAFMQCAVGERCGADGFCVADPCSAVTCGAGQVCVGGACQADACAGVKCGERQTCADGVCAGDPCAGVTCPTGQCLRGQCFSSRNPQGVGTKATDPGTTPPPPAAQKSGGCGSGEATPTAALLAAAALLAVRRRRRAAHAVAPRPAPTRRGPGRASSLLALALAGTALLASACGGGGGAKSPAGTAPDPAVCSASCGAVKCVDLAFDARNCGACGVACGAGDVCVDSKCGPGSPVAPDVTSVTPGAAASGTVSEVSIAGERFAAGAKLRISGAGDPVEVDTRFSDAGHLAASVDLTAVDPGSVELRVVNPGRVVSNEFGLTVVVPTPAIASVTPSSQRTGAKVTVHVDGSGLRAASTCLFAPLGGTLTGVPTRHPAGGGLDCDLDLTLAAPGAGQVVVQNEGVVRSAPAAFTVTTVAPTIDAGGLSPSSGKPGEIVRVKVTGSGFDPGSRVQLQGVDATTTFVAATQLYADLVLASLSPGTYPLRVVNGALASGTVTFTVNSALPVALSLTTTPAQPHLGDSVQIDVAGAAFDATCTVDVQPPGGAFAAVSGTQLASPAEVKATVTPSGTAGTWSARVTCGANHTAAFPFQVLSNVAVLAAVTPAGAPQGTSTTLVVSGSTFQPGIALRVSGNGKSQALTPSAVTASSITASLDVTGWDVGTYAITATNVGAAASNGVGFAVTPGLPRVSGVSPSTVAQSAGTKTVTLSGANFAPGASGSSVHAKSPDVQGGVEFVLPIAGVSISSVTSGAIALSVDPTALVPATYTLWVVNPGPSGPQTSATVTLIVTP